MSALQRLNNLTMRASGWTSRFSVPKAVADKLARALGFGFEAACVIAIALAASNIALTLLTPANIGAAQSGAPEINRSGPQNPTGGAHMAFFKSLDGKATPLAEANSKIKLFGARPSQSGLGTAIVSVNGGPQQSVSVGDRLKNGARITGVFADRIEISSGGKAAAVYLLASKQRSQRKLVSKISPTELSGLAQTLDLRIANNAATIGAAADSSLLANLGLAVGDKIQTADNSALVDEAALEQAFNRLIGGTSVSLEIERGGARIVKIINAADVALLLGGL